MRSGTVYTAGQPPEPSVLTEAESKGEPSSARCCAARGAPYVGLLVQAK